MIEQTPELMNRIRMLRKHAEMADIELTVKSDCNEADVDKAAAELSYIISRGD